MSLSIISCFTSDSIYFQATLSKAFEGFFLALFCMLTSHLLRSWFAQVIAPQDSLACADCAVAFVVIGGVRVRPVRPAVDANQTGISSQFRRLMRQLRQRRRAPAAHDRISFLCSAKTSLDRAVLSLYGHRDGVTLLQTKVQLPNGSVPN